MHITILFSIAGSFKYWQDQVLLLLSANRCAKNKSSLFSDCLPNETRLDRRTLGRHERNQQFLQRRMHVERRRQHPSEILLINKILFNNLVFIVKKRRSHQIGFNPTDPPYGINNQGGHAPLNTKTLDQDATHYGGVVEYNVHNLFGKFK